MPDLLTWQAARSHSSAAKPMPPLAPKELGERLYAKATMGKKQQKMEKNRSAGVPGCEVRKPPQPC